MTKICYAKRIAPLFIFCIITTACTGSGYKLDPTTISKIGEVKAQSIVVAKEIAIFPEEISSAGQSPLGGLIIAGINAKKEAEAEEAITPLRNIVKDLDFRSKFWETLAPALKENEWPQITEVETLTKSVPINASSTQRAGLLELETLFGLSNKASYLILFTRYRFVPKGSTMATGKGSATYVSSRFMNMEREQTLQKWTDTNASLYRKEITQGISQNVHMIQLALLNMGGKGSRSKGPRVQVKPAESRVVQLLPNRMGKNGHMGWVIEKNSERMLFQSEPGPFYSLPTSSFTIINN